MSTSLLWIFLLLILTNAEVNADFCPDNLPAGKCFDEKLIPMALGAIVTGFVFGIFIVSFGLFLLCKSKVKKKDTIPWVHQREPTNWSRDCQDIGIDNRLYKHERERYPGLGDNRPQHFVSDESFYLERETALSPSAQNSHVMDALDSLEDENNPIKTSDYHWAPIRARKNEVQHGDEVLGPNHKDQVFNVEKSTAANIMDDSSSDNDSI